MKRWVCLFSQTGKEIADLSEKLDTYPSLIVSNRKSLEGVDERIKKKVFLIPQTPSEQDYLEVFQEDMCITLHGFLRIIPKGICNNFEIYNGHPGLIDVFPILKGKDPQKKAFDLGLDYSGCVIHRVIEGVDEGEIIKRKEIYIKNFNLNQIFYILKEASLELWIEFLKESLCY